MTRSWLVLVACCTSCQLSAAEDAACRMAEPLRLRVQFAGEAPRDAFLQPLLPTGLRLVDAISQDEIWSTTRYLPGAPSPSPRTAEFGTALAAVHIDADGVHDRVYAGDRSGRVWRLDLGRGVPPRAWLHATVFAELGATGGGRGFAAPPDVAFIADAGRSWLNIALGTANTGAARADHRFYVLRDSLAEPRPLPLAESDLEHLVPPARVNAGNEGGYYLELGSSQVLGQSLTLDGYVHFAAVESARNLLAACSSGAVPVTPVAVSVTVLRAEDGQVATPTGSVAAADGNPALPQLRRPLPGTRPAGSGVELAASPAGSTGLVPCLVGNEPIANCSLDTRPRRSWWRREDAD